MQCPNSLEIAWRLDRLRSGLYPHGVEIIRVHDVQETIQAISVAKGTRSFRIIP